MNFEIDKDDISYIYTDTVKYISLFILIHMINYFFNGDEELFNIKFLKLLLAFIIAIIIYNLSIKKLFINDLEKTEEKNEIII
jgi:hypothetical protein